MHASMLLCKSLPQTMSRLALILVLSFHSCVLVKLLDKITRIVLRWESNPRPFRAVCHQLDCQNCPLARGSSNPIFSSCLCLMDLYSSVHPILWKFVKMFTMVNSLFWDTPIVEYSLGIVSSSKMEILWPLICSLQQSTFYSTFSNQ